MAVSDEVCTTWEAPARSRSKPNMNRYSAVAVNMEHSSIQFRPLTCSFNWSFGVLSYPERVGTPVVRPGSDYSAYYSAQFLMKDHVPQASPSISKCRHQCCSFSFFTSHLGLNARHAGTISCISDWLFPRRFTVGLAGYSAHQSLGTCIGCCRFCAANSGTRMCTCTTNKPSTTASTPLSTVTRHGVGGCIRRLGGCFMTSDLAPS